MGTTEFQNIANLLGLSIHTVRDLFNTGWELTFDLNDAPVWKKVR